NHWGARHLGAHMETILAMLQSVVIDLAAGAGLHPFLIETIQSMRIPNAFRRGEGDARIVDLNSAAARTHPHLTIHIERVAIAIRYLHNVNRGGLHSLLMRLRIEHHEPSCCGEPQAAVRSSVCSAPNRIARSALSAAQPVFDSIVHGIQAFPVALCELL